MHKLFRMFAVLCALMLSACLSGCQKTPQNSSGVQQTLSITPQYSCYNETQAFLDPTGALYTWGNDNQNTAPENGYTGQQLGQGSSLLYNNVPTQIAADVRCCYPFASALTTRDEQLLWGSGTGEYLESPRIFRTDIAAASPTLYLSCSGSLFGHYEYARIAQNPPFGKEDTRIMTNVTDYCSAPKIGYLTLKSDGSVWKFKMSASTSVEVLSAPSRIMTDVEKIIYTQSTSVVLFLKTDGSLWACGDNEFGACGNGEHGDFDRQKSECIVTEPCRVMEGVSDAWVCWDTCYALTEDGTLYGWGLNDYNLLLTGDEISTPTTGKRSVYTEPIEIFKEIQMFYPASDHCYALLKDATLWSWGCANKGLLGNGTQTERITLNLIDLSDECASRPILCQPTQILDNVKTVFGTTTNRLVFAQLLDDSLWYWGLDGVITDADGDWDTYNQTYNYYSRHEIIATPQPFDISTFHQGLGSKSK